MPISCTFALNNQKFSTLQCPGVGAFPAFSGTGKGRDNPAAVAKKDVGPLPPGRY
ncbi:tlde1 domain-containing protein [Burkholderia humptydooensis]|uniref:tlde1 domain-containing protein n=1 Tax=Burkholderia humptydooensis TaxID=430531 RepID=UPI0020165110|nr:tlde1 domain-containing protein [Burkholderia humptydooensis]